MTMTMTAPRLPQAASTPGELPAIVRAFFIVATVVIAMFVAGSIDGVEVHGTDTLPAPIQNILDITGLAADDVALSAPLTVAGGDNIDVDAAVAVLTSPESTGNYGRTIRWTKTNLTVAVNLDATDQAAMGADIDAAFAWVTENTGVTFTFVAAGTAADVTVDGFDAGKGNAHATLNADGSIAATTINLGCCRTRVVFEEIGQAMGAFGDHGPAGTLFSNDQAATGPTAFDATTLQVLYRLPVGTDTAGVRAALTN